MSVPEVLASREIGPGAHWLGGCFEIAPDGRPMHFHVSTYLIVGSTRTALYDTGDPAHWDAIAAELDRLLDGRPLDYVVPSHPELPHAGNLAALLRRYPDLEVHGDVRDIHLYVPEFAERLHTAVAGDRLDLGDRQLELVPAHVRDLPNSLWAFDTGAGLLLVSDGFSYLHGTDPLVTPDGEPAHEPGQCRLLSDELAGGPTVDQAAYGTGRALYWTRFVDVTETLDDVERLLRDRAVQRIGPCHGAVISDVDEILEIFRAAHAQVYEG